MTTIDRRAKLLSRKDWNDLRSFWLRHIPDLEQLEQEPVERLSQDVQLHREASEAPETGEYRFRAEVNPASLLFRESAFLMCKAVRTSCESARQIVDGLPTWAISTAHHSSLFALRGFIGLWGVGYVEIGNKFFLVDLHPSQPKGRRQSDRHAISDDGDVQLIRVPQMGQREWWTVYKRILRTVRGVGNQFPVIDELSHCELSRLSMHRNDLHYRLRWFYDDVLESLHIPTFGEFSDDAADEVCDRLGANEGSDGAIILNQLVLGNALTMLMDLARVSRRVATVVDRIRSSIENRQNEVVESWYSRLST